MSVSASTAYRLSIRQKKYVIFSPETAVDRQISFPLSHVLHANGERNGQPLLHDFTDGIQFMDIEETSGRKLHGKATRVDRRSQCLTLDYCVLGCHIVDD